MRTPLSRLPWFISSLLFVAALSAGALVTNYLGADYFKRTRLDEANPLAGVPLDAGSPASGRVLHVGEFRDGEPGHRGEGRVQIIAGSGGGPAILRIEEFSVTNGPDLFVVLSTSDGYSDEGALNLGGLKATDGNFNYEIPPGTDLDAFRSVVIWCRQFDVDFAVASLMRGPGASAPDASANPARETSPAAASPTTSAAATPQSSATQAATASQAPAETPSAAPTRAPTMAPTVAPTPAMRGPVVLATGQFRDGAPGHRGSGRASVGLDASGAPVLVLQDFSVTNGPDLHVILSTKADGGKDGLDAGPLKATDGTFSYQLPEGTDLSQFKSVTIYCVAFPTIFAYAPLES